MLSYGYFSCHCPAASFWQLATSPRSSHGPLRLASSHAAQHISRRWLLVPSMGWRINWRQRRCAGFEHRGVWRIPTGCFIMNMNFKIFNTFLPNGIGEVVFTFLCLVHVYPIKRPHNICLKFNIDTILSVSWWWQTIFRTPQSIQLANSCSSCAIDVATERCSRLCNETHNCRFNVLRMASEYHR